MTAAALAFLAGLLSILSPCVLPLLPIVLGAAAAQSRYGVFALASGVAIAFTALGLLLATVGAAIGIDAPVVRLAAAAIMIGLGILFLVPAWQYSLAAASAPFSNAMDRAFGGMTGQGASGQFAIGLLLGAVWSPCVGPTLGAASLLAAQGQDLARVTAIMAAFGLGAAIPLTMFGMASRAAFVSNRGRMLAFGHYGKMVFGIVLLLIGVSIVSGIDKIIETALVEASPAWLTSLTTRF